MNIIKDLRRIQISNVKLFDLGLVMAIAYHFTTGSEALKLEGARIAGLSLLIIAFEDEE